MKISKIKTLLSNNKNSSEDGFALIEVLLGVVIIILIGLVLMKSESIEYKKVIAKKINHQISMILSTAVQYYEYNDDVWPDSIKTLIDKGYLPQQYTGKTSDQWMNPYNQPYSISVKSSGEIKDLIISTNIPTEDAFVAQQAISALPKADVTPGKAGFNQLSATFVEPGVIKPLENAVKYQAIVKPETVIQKPDCGNTGLVPKIFVSIASFGTDNYGPAEDFRSYATDNGNNTWTVHLRELTNTGWSNASESINNLEVSTKCQAP